MASQLSVRERITLLFGLFALLGLALALVLVALSLRTWQQARETDARNAIAVQSLAAVKHFAFERGRTNVILRNAAPISDKNRAFIDDRRQYGDNAIARALQLAEHALPAEREEVAAAWAEIRRLREAVERDFVLPLAARDATLPGRWLPAANTLVARLENLLAHATEVKAADFTFAQLANLRIHALQFRNAVGSESTRLSGELSARRVASGEALHEAALLRGAAQQLWAHIERDAQQLNDPGLLAALELVRQRFFNEFRPLLDELIGAARQGRLPASGIETYTQKAVPALDSIIDMVDQVDRMVTEYASRQLHLAQGLLAGALASLAVMLVIAFQARRVLRRDFSVPLQAILNRIHALRGTHDPRPAEDAGDLGSIARALDLLDASLQEVHAARVAAESSRRELAGSEERFRHLFEKNHSVMLLIEPDNGLIVHANAAAAAYYGYAVEQLVGMSIAAINTMPPEDIARERARARREECGYFNFRHRLAGGQIRDVEVYSSPIESGGKPLLFSVIHDITARKEAERELETHRTHLEAIVAERTAELRAVMEAAQAASRAKSAFLATMSHELRTPMNAIIGMAGLALRQADDPRLRDRLGKINQASQHLLQVINDILDYSKIEADHMTLNAVDFRFREVLENLVSLLERRAEEKGLRLKLDLPEGLLRLTLRGDSLRLGQVLLNLATNAIKFTEHGSVTLRVQELDRDGDATLVRIAVEDTGIGIAPADQQRLFQAFEQADTSLTRKYGGTGLGLAISKRLVGLMGGDIGVDSTPGRGSTFWFTIRLQLAAQTDAAPAATYANEPTAADLLKSRHAGARILLAEDEPINQEVSRSLLADVGLVVDVAADGAEAVELARHQRYAMILMDMQMPRLNGLDATRMIRALPDHATTPILAMTANAFDDDRQTCLAAGMNDHLAKPIDPGLLYAVLLKWLDAAADASWPMKFFDPAQETVTRPM